MDTLLIALFLIAAIAIAPFLLLAAVVFLTKREINNDQNVESSVIEDKKERPVSLREMKMARKEEFSNLPLWKKPPGYVLRGTGSLGALMLWICVFNSSWVGMGIGLVIAIGSELLYQWLVGGLRGHPNA